MNRQQRRADAAKTRAAALKHEAIRVAMAYLANSSDPTVTGATIVTADGDPIYISADLARATMAKPGGVH